MSETSNRPKEPKPSFRYVNVLLPQFREGALRDIEAWHKDMEDACHFFLPRATKAEFLLWVEDIWEQASEVFNDYMSLPDA